MTQARSPRSSPADADHFMANLLQNVDHHHNEQRPRTSQGSSSNSHSHKAVSSSSSSRSIANPRLSARELAMSAFGKPPPPSSSKQGTSKQARAAASPSPASSSASTAFLHTAPSKVSARTDNTPMRGMSKSRSIPANNAPPPAPSPSSSPARKARAVNDADAARAPRAPIVIDDVDVDGDDWLADLDDAALAGPSKPPQPPTKTNANAQPLLPTHAPSSADDFGDDDAWLADLDDQQLEPKPPSNGDRKPSVVKPSTSAAAATPSSANAPSSTNGLIERASRTQSRLWAERAKRGDTASRIHRSYVRCKVMAVRRGEYTHTIPNSSRTVQRPEVIVYGLEKPRRGAHFRTDDPDVFTQAPETKAAPVEEADGKDQSAAAAAATAATRKIVLREEWTATRVAIGDYVHCVGNWETREMDEEDEEILRSVERQAAEIEQEREEKWGERAGQAKKEEPGDGSERLGGGRVKSEEPGDPLAASAPPAVKREDTASPPPLGDELPPASFESFTADLFAGLDDKNLATFAPMPEPAPPARRSIPTMDLLSSSPLSDSIHADNLLILHPDVLVTATAVCDVPTCVRKPIVKSRINTAGAADKSSQPLVMGNMLHEVLQSCLTGMSLLDVSRVAPLDTDEALQPYLDMPFPLQWFGPGKTDFSLAFLVRQAKLQVLNNLDGLLCCGLDTLAGEEKLLDFCRPFGEFARRYLEDVPARSNGDETLRGLFKGIDGMLHMAGVFNQEAVVLDSRTTIPTLARVTHVFDVEEEIWSPMYGLKGKMDVSVEVELQETDAERPAWRGGNHYVPGQQQRQPATSAFYRRTQSVPDPRGGEAKKRYASIMPLEIKTGRSVDALEHRAQTMLYTLMMSDRYGTDVNSGLLYYTRSGDMHRVKRTRNEVRGLIVGRNELAYWIRRNGRSDQEDEEDEGVDGGGADAQAAISRAVQTTTDGTIDLSAIDFDDEDEGKTALPPSIDNERECGRCFAQNGCMLYRRAVDRVIEDPEQPTEIEPLYSRITSHLSPIHAAFFEKWERLLSLEEEDMVKFKRELWTLTAAAREEVGRCFSNMALDSSFKQSGPVSSGGRFHSNTYRFLKKDVESSPGLTLQGGLISVGDPVVVSIEPATFSVAQGFVVGMSPHSTTVGLDHHLDAILERAAVEQGQADLTKLDITFRVDRDEYSDGMAKIRGQLAHFFYSVAERDQRHRELIVDLAPPRFDYAQTIADDELPAELNEDQRAAMKKVFAAQDYALVLGMPGTGKTTTIAEMIKLLVARGNTILLASYTHSAVDTILRKLRNAPEVRMLRLGNIDRVHSDIKDYTLPQASTVEELDHLINLPNVIATTCLSTGHATFARRKFDYCIVDEASQITLPTCLGPLRFADRFVLVGDHFQLPPLVRNPIARKGGLDVSLFKRLSEAHNAAVVYLTRQYRMNESIMLLSNHLIYDGLLKCGNEQVAKQVLKLPRRQWALDEIHAGGSACGSPARDECWIARLLAESCQAVFVDTDAVPGLESRRGRMVQNEVEAGIIQQLARTLVLGGVPRSDIAVITPYRQQLKLLTSLLLPSSSGHDGGKGSIEVMTADRSQGRDKPVVLISLVRSNDFNARGRGSGIGELLNDWRRINVALTRAQRKVIIVGSQSTLSAAPLLEDFFGLMREQRWIVKLPRGALDLHPAASGVGSGSDCSQQSQTSATRRVKKEEEGGGDENMSPPGSQQTMQQQRRGFTSSQQQRSALDELQQPSSSSSSQDDVKGVAFAGARSQKRKRHTQRLAIDDGDDRDDDYDNDNARRDQKVGEAILRRRPILRDALFAD